jgi:hypothetical protein
MGEVLFEHWGICVFMMCLGIFRRLLGEVLFEISWEVNDIINVNTIDSMRGVNDP